jgi:hypothetical protein
MKHFSSFGGVSDEEEEEDDDGDDDDDDDSESILILLIVGILHKRSNSVCIDRGKDIHVEKSGDAS